MKFISPLALLAIPATASAWSTAISAPRSLPAVRSTRIAPATILHSYSTATSGEADTDSFRLSFAEGESTISPWHDIPLKGSSDGTYNAVIEIPKMTKAKMEVATKEEGNPIAQDVKKGELRDYHGPIFWNYGCLPQTWEDPNIKHPELGCFGDDDPIDVVEIGKSMLPMGTVKEVKPLGVIAMIDDGELDWKIVAVAKDDPLAEEYNDIDDVPAAVKDGIREWFRWYKTPDGKPLNSFGFDEKFLDVAKTKEAIQETNNHWMKLKADGSDKLWVN